MINAENHFGKTIRSARLKARIGLREAAKNLGISAAHLSRFENNKRGITPNEGLLNKMSKLLGISRQTLKFAAANISKSGLRSLDKMLTEDESREIKTFYQLTRQHGLSVKEAVALFSRTIKQINERKIKNENKKESSKKTSSEKCDK